METIAPYIYHTLTFVDAHLVYWVIPVALFFNIKYLCRQSTRQSTRQSIGMVGWGDASRIKQPLFFYFLWVLHIVASTIFILLFLGYILHVFS